MIVYYQNCSTVWRWAAVASVRCCWAAARPQCSWPLTGIYVVCGYLASVIVSVVLAAMLYVLGRRRVLNHQLRCWCFRYDRLPELLVPSRPQLSDRLWLRQKTRCSMLLQPRPPPMTTRRSTTTAETETVPAPAAAAQRYRFQCRHRFQGCTRRLSAVAHDRRSANQHTHHTTYNNMTRQYISIYDWTVTLLQHDYHRRTHTHATKKTPPNSNWHFVKCCQLTFKFDLCFHSTHFRPD